MDDSYIVRLFCSAWDITLADIKPDKTRVIVIKLAIAIIAIAVMYVYNWDEWATEDVGRGIAILTALVLLIPVYFLINLILAPARLQKEADEKISDLQRQIFDAEKQQQILNKLWELRSKGITLRNEPIKTEAEFIDWKKRYEETRAAILEAAKERNENLYRWLEHLERMGPVPSNLVFYGDKVSGMNDGTRILTGGEHRLLTGILTEVLVRLQKHLQRDLI